jgi:hypothetical protein
VRVAGLVDRVIEGLEERERGGGDLVQEGAARPATPPGAEVWADRIHDALPRATSRIASSIRTFRASAPRVMACTGPSPLATAACSAWSWSPI